MKKHENTIYITGDTHGDLERFKKMKRLKKGDFLIICGDFGFIWDGSKSEKRLLKRLGRRKYHILFVDGLHENFDELNSYPEEEWNGGKIRHISGNLRYLMRGEIFTLGKKTALTFGGGRVEKVEPGSEGAADVQSREEEIAKSPEIPKEAEYRNGLRSIARHNGRVDYIISHEAPSMIAEFLELSNSGKSRPNAYLDILGESCTFERWFFGHHHINRVVTPKYYALFDRVMSADEIIKYN
ncbi:MAG: metallophosphoesterase [Oscillospiraceae bacterium]|jgi:predicted phosphodiesterase|nr:metallophosphoesterase [Oscillospiraceae bacterium]